MTEIVPARPAATVLLLRDDPFEVLMLRRRPGESFGSALVFPGGVVDAEDGSEAWLEKLVTGATLSPEQRALRIAVLREAYEEVGLIAASDAPVICTPGLSFGEALGEAKLDLEALVPFAQWITPIERPARFDTHFFLCAAPAGEAICDGIEAVAIEWARPADLLAREGDALLFPTRLNLMRLAESSSVAEALSAARARPVIPVQVTIERQPGGTLHRIPAEAGYPISEHLVPR